MKGEIKIMFISDSIKYVGVDDKDIDLLRASTLFLMEFHTIHILFLMIK